MLIMQAPGRFCDCLPAHAAAPAHAPDPFGLKDFDPNGAARPPR